MVEIIWEWLVVWDRGWWRFGCTTSLISEAISFGVNGSLFLGYILGEEKESQDKVA